MPGLGLETKRPKIGTTDKYMQDDPKFVWIM